MEWFDRQRKLYLQKNLQQAYQVVVSCNKISDSPDIMYPDSSDYICRPPVTSSTLKWMWTSLGNLARECDRYWISDRSEQQLQQQFYKMLGVVKENKSSQVKFRSKI